MVIFGIQPFLPATLQVEKMNTLIISTFSCTFDSFKKDVTGFITDMGTEVVSDYEFVKVDEHKSHLFMNIDFYISNFLEQCPKDKIYKVITNEKDSRI